MKEAIKKFYSKHTMLSNILIGMIGFPIAGLLVGGLIAVLITILAVFFGKLGAVAVFFMMTVGAIGGYIWSR